MHEGLSPRIFCLMGPTAIGKTAMAILLAQHLPVQLISVDSAMVYRGMDIGTGKPTPEELRVAPHALIDCCDPAESYSAGRFCVDANARIQEALNAGRWPCLVGGTMLYYRALLQGLADLPSADPAVRLSIEQSAAVRGWPALHAELAVIDPETAQGIHPHDAQRIQRALEIWQVSGRTRTAWIRETPVMPYQVTTVALWPTDREALYARIASRFRGMLDAGFVEEVRQLHARGDLHLTLPSMRAVGYQQLWHYVTGAVDFETSCAQAVIATRHLAKRQLTWLRTWPGLIKIEDQDPDRFHRLLMHCRSAFSDLRE